MLFITKKLVKVFCTISCSLEGREIEGSYFFLSILEEKAIQTSAAPATNDPNKGVHIPAPVAEIR